MRWRYSSVPGPDTSIFANGVMSKMATRSLAARCSAAMIGDHSRASHPERGGKSGMGSSALASYHCGRSQPAFSKNSPPSSTCLAWNGVTRRPRGLFICWSGCLMS